jgi:hypothetical protein
MTKISEVTAVTPTTTIKVSIYNGDTKLKFQFTQKDSEMDVDSAKKYIFDALNKVMEQQNKLKLLGAKNNFFGLSEYKENFIDIDIIKDSETTTFLSGMTFKFSQFKKVENKIDAFNIIFDTHLFLSQNNLVIE